MCHSTAQQGMDMYQLGPHSNFHWHPFHYNPCWTLCHRAREWQQRAVPGSGWRRRPWHRAVSDAAVRVRDCLCCQRAWLAHVHCKYSSLISTQKRSTFSQKFNPYQIRIQSLPKSTAVVRTLIQWACREIRKSMFESYLISRTAMYEVQIWIPLWKRAAIFPARITLMMNVRFTLR